MHPSATEPNKIPQLFGIPEDQPFTIDEKIKVMTDYPYMQHCAHGIPEMEEVIEEMKKRNLPTENIVKVIPASSLPSAEEVRAQWEKQQQEKKKQEAEAKSALAAANGGTAAAAAEAAN